jgi:PIN domain nuclease of toxin-antitoxin system
VKYLLDTHYAFWVAVKDRRVSTRLQKLLADDANDFFFSVINIWEIAVKRSHGRTGYAIDPRDLRQSMLANAFQELQVTGDHAIAVESLPLLHKDPFDRLLIAQAAVEGIILLTADKMVAKYPGPIQMI